MKFTYTGTDERTFPSIAVTVQPGDSFDAPENFSAANVSASKSTAKPAPTVGDE